MEARGRVVAQALLLAAVGVAGILLLAPGFPEPAVLLPALWTHSAFAHAAIFGVIGLLVPHVFPRVPRIILCELLVIAAAGAELAQYLVPERDPAWPDLVANALGALTTLLPIPRRAA